MAEDLFQISVAQAGEASQELRNLEKGLSQRTTRRMYQAALRLTATIRKMIVDPSIFEGGANRTRTGKLIQSWQTFPVSIRGGNDVVTGAFSRHPAAAIHEFGGEVKPTEAKALTIPVTQQAARARAADFDLRAEFFPTKNPDIIGRLVEKSSGETQYLLAKKVTLPARNYLTKAQEEALPEIMELVDSAVREELEEFEARGRA
jgi:phage gpG-like protein